MAEFLENLPDDTKRSACPHLRELRELRESVTGEAGMLRGPSLVGFGTEKRDHWKGI